MIAWSVFVMVLCGLRIWDSDKEVSLVVCWIDASSSNSLVKQFPVASAFNCLQNALWLDWKEE